MGARGLGGPYSIRGPLPLGLAPALPFSGLQQRCLRALHARSRTHSTESTVHTIHNGMGKTWHFMAQQDSLEITWHGRS